MAESLVDELVERIKAALSQITDHFEIVLVEDCGSDWSWDKIAKNCGRDPRVKGLKLSRNYGQHYAITAGLDFATGEWMVVMDCDLQDRPEEIGRLYRAAQRGFEVVLARRKERHDTYLKRTLSKTFCRVFSYLTDTRQDGAIANFGLYHRKVIDATCRMRESIRFFPTMVRWVGFRCATVDVTHGSRPRGRSSYTFTKQLRLAFDAILAYSDKPLRLTVIAGALISLVAFGMALYMIILALRGEIRVMGYASLIVSVWFFSGLTLLVLGVLGLYLGKTFEGVKQRPLYVVDTTINVVGGLGAPERWRSAERPSASMGPW